MIICVRKSINCRELWKDYDFEIIAVEIMGSTQANNREIVGIYRAPNEEMSAIYWLAEPVGQSRNSGQCIIGGDLNLPSVNWNGTEVSTSTV